MNFELTKTTFDISLIDSTGSLSMRTGITGLRRSSGREELLTSCGRVVPLEHIISVNGIYFE